MFNNFHLALLLLLPLSACKKDEATKKGGEDIESQSPKNATETNVDKKDVEPAESPAAAKAMPAQELGETALIIFDAATEQSVSGTWETAGINLSLHAKVEKNEEQVLSYDAKIFAIGNGMPEKEIFACKALKPAAGGRIEVLLRGDKIHILCINPPSEGQPGETDAVRFGYDSTKQELTAAGSYSGEGIVDPDTIDLDEAEDG